MYLVLFVDYSVVLVSNATKQESIAIARLQNNKLQKSSVVKSVQYILKEDSNWGLQ